ncbi:MAG: type II secretion system F family protein [Candidatus Gracilibacteria bacterium]|nr:type II secretion system F family protein [Candidatus Gracilibacteria bacterium]
MSDLYILDSEKKENISNNNDYNENNIGLSIIDKFNIFILSKQALKIKQKVVFFRLLSTMINAGITLTKGISILEKQEKEGTVLKNILIHFLKYLKQGKGFSECMSMFNASFSPAEIGIIESGEKTGKLNTTLRDLANQIEKIASINGKLKSALMYPAMIIVVVIGVVVVMMTMVVPKLLEIFSGSQNLPATTRLLITISDFFVVYWWLIITFILGFIIFVLFWKKTPKGKYHFDRIILKLPIFGMITQKIILSKFSRILSGMLKSGVSIVESLRIVSDAVGNEVYRQRILFLRDDVKKGLRIYESLEDDPLFPEMMVSMIQIGEQTAKIDEIILKVADFYDEEVDNTILVINKLLEPIIIVFMAVIVGFIAIAIMQPIMNLADTISNS